MISHDVSLHTAIPSNDFITLYSGNRSTLVRSATGKLHPGRPFLRNEFNGSALVEFRASTTAWGSGFDLHYIQRASNALGVGRVVSDQAVV